MYNAVTAKPLNYTEINKSNSQKMPHNSLTKQQLKALEFFIVANFEVEYLRVETMP